MAIEAGLEDSALLSGEGNPRGGGIGRMLARGSSSLVRSMVDEECSIVNGQIHNYCYEIIVRTTEGAQSVL